MGSVIRLHPKGIGRGEEMDRAMDHALDWILRFGCTTRSILESSLFPSRSVEGLTRALLARHWAQEIECKSGSHEDAVLVLTENGAELAASRYDRVIPYPELHWESCHRPRCDDYLWGQKLTAENLHKGTLSQFWTARQLTADEAYPFPDMEWLMKDGRLWAVTVDSGVDYGLRHDHCVSISIREGSSRRYDREVLITNDQEIVRDYHQRLTPGNTLPVWETDPGDFSPVDSIVVPDLQRRMLVFLADPWGEVLV